MVFSSYAHVDSKIRCTVSSVLPLSDANLKCYFPEDISITRKDFTVYHHSQHGSPGKKYANISLEVHLISFFFTFSLSLYIYISLNDLYCIVTHMLDFEEGNLTN